MNTHQHNNEQPDKAQQKAKIESLKKSWQLRKDINEKLSKIKNKIAVYSGKGGVGKTTVAVNIAAFFAQQGNSVGILDLITESIPPYIVEKLPIGPLGINWISHSSFIS